MRQVTSMYLYINNTNTSVQIPGVSANGSGFLTFHTVEYQGDT